MLESLLSAASIRSDKIFKKVSWEMRIEPGRSDNVVVGKVQ
jgi:hypothetical protein